jgi:hypothetical protein
MYSEEELALIGRLNELEVAGEYEELIKACERAIDGREIHNVQFVLSRSCFALAAKGNEMYAWPALLAALDGIERQFQDKPDVLQAVGICRWVLDLFADPHRMDVPGFLESLEDRQLALSERGETEATHRGVDKGGHPRLDLSQL